MDFWTIKRMLEIGKYNFTIVHNDNTNGVTIIIDGYEGLDFVPFEFDKLGFLLPLQ